MVKTQFSPATKGTYSKEVAVSANQLGRPNTDPPTVVDQDNLTLYSFVLNTDKITYDLEIPEDYAGGDLDISVMWTNDGGDDDNGLNVKWQLDYQVASGGDPVSGDHGNSPKRMEDTYTSDTGWIEHHTAVMTIAAADFSGKHHILLKLSAITPAGAALTCDPNLICMCFYYLAKWGRKP